MIRFEPRESTTLTLRVARPVTSVAAALALAGVPLAAAGAPILEAFWLMAKGAAGSLFAITETLTRATPLIFTGLAATIAFRARLFNIGGEGQLYAGALAAVAVGSGSVAAPAPVLITLILVAAALAGALLMLGPALLKVRLGIDEVVTTLLLNFVVLLLVQMMLEGPLKDPMGGGWPQSEPISESGMLPPIVQRMRLHSGFLIALVASLLAYVVMTRMVLGLKIKAVGDNPAAARFAGISLTGVTAAVALLSGGLAGVAGASEVAGLKGYLTADLSRGFGYSGIVVAMLAGLHPVACVPAAIFIAGVFVGADTMSRSLGVSTYIADLVVALALLCTLVSGFFTRVRLRLS